MSAEPWPAGIGLRILDAVDSTNAEAIRMAADAPGPVWVLARRQTRGRARRGRAWHDPEGNFAASLLMRPEGPPEALALRSFVAALALRDALAAAGAGGLALKWPNDVLLHGGKLAGILLETVTTAGARHLVVGVGVNLRHTPPPAPGAVPPVNLRSATGIELTPEDMLAHLAPAFARWERVLSTHGFAPLRRAFLGHAARLGQPIVARTMRDRFDGTFEGIDDTGALVLRTAQGRIALPAADVFFDGEDAPCC